MLINNVEEMAKQQLINDVEEMAKQQLINDIDEMAKQQNADIIRIKNVISY